MIPKTRPHLLSSIFVIAACWIGAGRAGAGHPHPAAGGGAPGGPPAKREAAAKPSTSKPDAPARQEAASDPVVEAAVRWMPFAEEAFLRAQALNRPILLVVTVRWNRQAVRFLDEVLESAEVARIIRDHYVPVLVDADLRPDIRDRFPMGGWPAITILTPLGDPVYYRPERKGAKPLRMTASSVVPEKFPGFLRETAQYYKVISAKGAEAAGFFHKSLLDEIREDKKVSPVESGDLQEVAELLRENADGVHGGFGRSPKYLPATAVEACLMFHRRGDQALLDTAERTLDAAKALMDPVEGGMHRLASGEDWTGLQYEKLLDRNADALEAYGDAYRATARNEYLDAARRIAGYILKTLSLDTGGFAYAQTADMASADGGDYYRATGPARAKRVAPPVLQTTITAPTARAIVALMRYASLAADPAARVRAMEALQFLDSKLYARGRGVLHAWDTREKLGPQTLKDQLAFIAAHLEAFEQTGRKEHMEIAVDVAGFVRNNLRDPKTDLLNDRLPQAGGPALLQLGVHAYEENCEAARLFARLHYFRRAVARGESWNQTARDVLAGMAPRFGIYGPRAADYGLAAAEYLDPPIWVVFVGNPAHDPTSQSLFDAAWRLDMPFRLRQILDPDNEADLALIRDIGLIRREPPVVYFSRGGETSEGAVLISELTGIYAKFKAADEKPVGKPAGEPGKNVPAVTLPQGSSGGTGRRF